MRVLNTSISLVKKFNVVVTLLTIAICAVAFLIGTLSESKSLIMMGTLIWVRLITSGLINGLFEENSKAIKIENKRKWKKFHLGYRWIPTYVFKLTVNITICYSIIWVVSTRTFYDNCLTEWQLYLGTACAMTVVASTITHNIILYSLILVRKLILSSKNKVNVKREPVLFDLESKAVI